MAEGSEYRPPADVSEKNVNPADTLAQAVIDMQSPDPDTVARGVTAFTKAAVGGEDDAHSRAEVAGRLIQTISAQRQHEQPAIQAWNADQVKAFADLAQAQGAVGPTGGEAPPTTGV